MKIFLVERSLSNGRDSKIFGCLGIKELSNFIGVVFIREEGAHRKLKASDFNKTKKKFVSQFTNNRYYLYTVTPLERGDKPLVKKEKQTPRINKKRQEAEKRALLSSSSLEKRSDADERLKKFLTQ